MMQVALLSEWQTKTEAQSPNTKPGWHNRSEPLVIEQRVKLWVLPHTSRGQMFWAWMSSIDTSYIKAQEAPTSLEMIKWKDFLSMSSTEARTSRDHFLCLQTFMRWAMLVPG